MHWPDITAMVPVIEIPALGGAPVEDTCQTQAIGSVCFKSFIVAMRMNIPETQDSTRLTNMKNCRNERRTQSLLKSFTSARSVPMWVAVESNESIQIMKM